MRLNNAGLPGTDDLRDLWNQQTPFAIAEEFLPAFRKRMVDSLDRLGYARRQGGLDASGLIRRASNVYLDDFLFFDVSKPMDDKSFLEIEKSTLHGTRLSDGRWPHRQRKRDRHHAYLDGEQRPGIPAGRSNAGNTTGGSTFPYLAPPNTELQTVSETVELAASPEKVWDLIGQFGGTWHPLIAKIRVTGSGIGQLRTIETIDGKQLIERLDEVDNSKKSYRYTMISGVPAAVYMGWLDVKPKGAAAPSNGASSIGQTANPTLS